MSFELDKARLDGQQDPEIVLSLAPQSWDSENTLAHATFVHRFQGSNAGPSACTEQSAITPRSGCGFLMNHVGDWADVTLQRK